MKVDFRNIIIIVIVSSLIGFAYNFLNPKGIPLIKQERILIFENAEEVFLDSTEKKVIEPMEIVTEKSELGKTDSLIVQEVTPETPKPFSQPIAIKLSRAYQLYNQGVKFIDSRSKEEYAQGHIKGAINIPFYESEKYEDVLNKIDKNDLIVTYCSGEDCDTSILHGDELFDKGYKRVYIFHGGWNDWLDAGYPIEGIK